MVKIFKLTYGVKRKKNRPRLTRNENICIKGAKRFRCYLNLNNKFTWYLWDSDSAWWNCFFDKYFALHEKCPRKVGAVIRIKVSYGDSIQWIAFYILANCHRNTFEIETIYHMFCRVNFLFLSPFTEHQGKKKQ